MTKKIHQIASMPGKLLCEIGQLLAAKRKARQWRQVDLAERLNVSRQTVARMEQGDPNVAIGILFSAFWLLDIKILESMDFSLTKEQKKLKRIRERKGKITDDNF